MEQINYLDVPIMKWLKPFFKLFHIRPFITGTSIFKWYSYITMLK